MWLPGQVGMLVARLTALGRRELERCGKFTIPGLVRLELKHKPARPAGKRRMFCKEMNVAAKPASKVVKAAVEMAVLN